MPRTNTLETIKGRAQAIQLTEMLSAAIMGTHDYALVGFIAELSNLAEDVQEEVELAKALRTIKDAVSNYWGTTN